MASDGFTRTEQIANAICDRYHLPPTDELTSAIREAPFTPLEAAGMHDAATLADRVFAAILGPVKKARRR